MSPTVDPKALGAVLDLVAKAETSVAAVINLYPVIQALVKLANQPYPVGAIVPVPVESDGASKEA